MAQKCPVDREGMCEEQSDSSVLPHKADADVPMCAEFFHIKAITGCRNTQFWALKPGEGKGAKSRKGGDSLGVMLPQERRVIAVVSCCTGKEDGRTICLG